MKINNSVMTLFVILTLIVVSANLSFAQSDLYNVWEDEKVESSLSDLGRMWTFDNVPVDYFDKEYGFRPTEEWLINVQKSALQFGWGCSAAFVSEDGLIMTNHHCGRGQLPGLQKEGEDLLRDGFYAVELDDEREVSGLFVDQLIFIHDVSNEILEAIETGTTDEEKIKNRDEKIKKIEEVNKKETDLVCKVVTLYNGGEYAVYGYKRYDDIRLVMAPDFQIAATGWDWDNFTYPRYELDFAFYRAYDVNGKPVKVENFFRWSKNGAKEGEPIFVVGRPGNTDRLLSVAQLEYLRDKIYPQLTLLYDEIYRVYLELFENHSGNESDLLNSVMGWGNARKSYAGSLKGLRDPNIMTRKIDFEKKLIEKINADPVLNLKYGHVWEGIKTSLNELRSYSDELRAFRLNPRFQPEYFTIANNLIKLAAQLKLPEEERDAVFKSDKLNETINDIFPSDLDAERQFKFLRAHANFVTGILKTGHPLVKKMYNGLTGNSAAEYVLKNSVITTKEGVLELSKIDPDEILNSSDPFIYFIRNTQDKLKELESKAAEINSTLQVLNQLLGEAVFAVYGETISPDATSTLRISDGIIKGYEYNGTIAPGKTTFYGLWDRYNSFNKEVYPWGLHERWQIPPEELDLSIPIGFASTNDIVGGNSGSSVINKNAEVVGLIHDGNMESLAGYFIYLPENNRGVASDSYGLMEALKWIYKTDRLLDELKNGKIIQ